MLTTLLVKVTTNTKSNLSYPGNCRYSKFCLEMFTFAHDALEEVISIQFNNI